MSSSNALISAPGLTEDQIQTERAWLEGYGKDVDSLDWSKWEKYWDQDAFLQVANSPRVHGKGAIEAFYRETFINVSEYVRHDYTRYSFDLPLGLIYMSATVSFRVKGDPKGRTIQVSAIGVIHKRPGELVATGGEMYFDNSPIVAVIQEVLGEKVV